MSGRGRVVYNKPLELMLDIAQKDLAFAGDCKAVIQDPQ